jgi:hypothetical protein
MKIQISAASVFRPFSSQFLKGLESRKGLKESILKAPSPLLASPHIEK